MKKINVYLDGLDKERKVVEAELVKDNPTTVWVKLPDGNVIVRKRKRDIVESV